MENISNEEKKKLYSLFKNIGESAVTTELNTSQDSNILLVDGL
jgi:hypothetical protein